MLAKTARNALAKPRPTFRFRGCLHLSKNGDVSTRRRASTATIPASADDRSLIPLFDQPEAGTSRASTNSTGLFGHSFLTSPAAFTALANSTLRRAHLLTERILQARRSREELSKVVKNLDRLSDLLCGVIDLAELVRNAHPSAQWVKTADEVYETLCEFMNVLNTHVGLYEVLNAVLSDREIVKSLSREAYQTALIFWRDFEKSGIRLPPEQRNEFVSLSSEIIVLGRQFLNEAAAPRPPATITSSELRDLKDKGMGVRLQLQARFTQRELLVYPGSLQAQMIMRSAPSEEPRRKLYIASNSSTAEQIATLENMLKARARLARLVGKDSYAHMTLADKMARSPENVHHFLDALLDHTSPHARDALLVLSLRKQAHLGLPSPPTIQAWDRDYYCPPEPPAPPVPLPPLTLGTVFMALSRLFRHLYGITLRPADVELGEAWNTDVRKLEVVDEETGVIGWIYADLFGRRGKASGAAHYTVRCSRRVDDDDENGDLALQGLQLSDAERQSLELSKAFEALGRRPLHGHDGIYQLPVVVLLCDFARPSAQRGATVLEWHEVLTLFHEMGHAMHSMIGRTEYQNVSGTRCATDFVELPSILMEHFLNSPAVLALFDPKSRSSSLQIGNYHEDACHHIDTHYQILLAILDQAYHSPDVLQPEFDSTSTFSYLQKARGLIPYVPGTSFQTQFGHLFGYGATYYSYLFDRAIASRVWRILFSDDPLDRETGERYKQEVLRFGGGNDPWTMVSTLLEAPELRTGDAAAMREVGQWKIEDEAGMSSRH
ncbi:mitochondrial intermediate peptidase [Gloeophyllum trabeum ATCC 11539]|uniref:Mitochondrial intermediate peptidase n=1 Tax=Gloeophyllum trabeum (strain ATCC 11539 / FP-39264 / Madison 617) TaxID=670483 RepID=S7RZH6_GLOTA|nr:mitochondrial intermediate peptidase [Gloeophyllum trabeum ATCC 11539]EPQ60415.1 mitochondrial intermediate peptidase [Gloeophyllum trabeum ATCC 11539]